ncbi:MAG: OmpA family protein [Flavobacteriaceae bacterium]|nr:OmpA family protein [Flavobacteriaceae bacterium]
MKKGIIFILLLTSYFYGFTQSTGKYQIKFLEVNKNNSDYGVAILDNNKLIFTSAEEAIAGSKKNYNPRKELFVGDIDYDGEIKNIEPVTNKENNKYNTTGIAYTNDSKTVYFSRNKYLRKTSKQKLDKNLRLDLFKANVDTEGNWTNIEKLPFNSDDTSTGYPVLNNDNTKLYFVSNRLPSQGGTDIFVVDLLKDGTFGKPKNLGKNVNTSGNETTPFLSEEDILYFSSDGHPGKGKLDVFAVEIYDDSTSEIYQLAAPINSINDDFAYIVNKDNNQGFFTSNRLQGKDNDDLYSFTLAEDVRPGECFISVDGRVKDIDTQEVISGATVDLYNDEGDLLESTSTYVDGTYKFTVSCANEYTLIASNPNYNNDQKNIEILEENYHTALHTNLNLSKIYKDKPVIKRLQPIYYDFDDATITAAAAKEMDKIVSVMNENPNLIIEASAFADSRGTNTYNKGLSEKRAKAAVKYLRSQGIDTERIKAKGYGEEKLINQCINGIECDEEAHQMNRRTEFNFINIQDTKKKKSSGSSQSELVQSESKQKEEVIKKPDEIVDSDQEPDQKQVTKVKEPEYVENNYKVVKTKQELSKENDQNNKEIKQEDKAITSNNLDNTNQVSDEKQQSNVESNYKATETKQNEIAKKSVSLVSSDQVSNEKTKTSISKSNNVKNSNEVAEAEPEIINERELYEKEVRENKQALKSAQSKKSYSVADARKEALNRRNSNKESIKEELVYNFNSSIVATNEESNKVLNYIEKEKIKAIDKFSALEKKYEIAINEHKEVSHSLKIEKEKLTVYLKSIEELEETGWSNIIEYKNTLAKFNKRYDDLTLEKGKISFIESVNSNSLLSLADKKDREILEENLRINNMEVVAMKMNSSGKYQKTNNANKTELIKVSFKLLHNNKVDSGKKDAHLVLQNPEGKTEDAKGIFTLKDGEIEKKYTNHAIIDYNNNDTNVVMYIQRRGETYEKGVYPVKLFLEGELVGVSNLNLQNSF